LDKSSDQMNVAPLRRSRVSSQSVLPTIAQRATLPSSTAQLEHLEAGAMARGKQHQVVVAAGVDVGPQAHAVGVKQHHGRLSRCRPGLEEVVGQPLGTVGLHIGDLAEAVAGSMASGSFPGEGWMRVGGQLPDLERRVVGEHVGDASGGCPVAEAMGKPVTLSPSIASLVNVAAGGRPATPAGVHAS
jgi:hypothetical protein